MQKNNNEKQFENYEGFKFAIMRITAKIKSRLLIFNHQDRSIHCYSITHRAMSPPNSSYDVT